MSDFLCQNRPTTKKRVFFDNHTVPKFAWYGETNGTRFIAVKNGKKWGMVWHRYMTTWSNEIRMDILDFIAKNPCEECKGVTPCKVHIYPGRVNRTRKTKTRIPSKIKEAITPKEGLSKEYVSLSRELYGNSIDMNGKRCSIRKSSVLNYMDGTGMGSNFDNSDRRPMMPQFPVKSGKRK